MSRCSTKDADLADAHHRGSHRSDPDWVFDHGALTTRPATNGSKNSLWAGKCETFNVGRRHPTPPALDENPPLRLVGNPSQAALAEHLASELPFHPSTRIDAIARRDDGWYLTTGDHELGALISSSSTCPAHSSPRNRGDKIWITYEPTRRHGEVRRATTCRLGYRPPQTSSPVLPLPGVLQAGPAHSRAMGDS